MSSLRFLTQWMGAYSIAACIGYALVSAGVTAHNLLRLRRVGTDIEAVQAFSTAQAEHSLLAERRARFHDVQLGSDGGVDKPFNY